MAPRVPPIASGYRGSRTNTTLEDNMPNQFNFCNSRPKSNNIIGRTTHVATNLRSYFIPVNRNNPHDDSQHHENNGRYHHGITSARNRHSHCGSCWTDSEAACRFRAQLAQFDTGTISFRARICPSASQLITAIQKESPSAQLHQKRSQLAASTYQISLHKQHAQNQVSRQIENFFR
jgi:hypothetical protein